MCGSEADRTVTDPMERDGVRRESVQGCEERAAVNATSAGFRNREYVE